MCGIFGVLPMAGRAKEPKVFKELVDRLFILSQSRGTEAAGVALANKNTIQVYKRPMAASRFIKTFAYRRLMEEATRFRAPDTPLALIGHSRLVTDGAAELHVNNQPVTATGIAGVHNGIVVNVDDLWPRFPLLKRGCDVDSEVIFQLIRHFLDKTGSISFACCKTFEQIEGMASIACFFEDNRKILLATNNGSLYLCHNPKKGLVVFASERQILQRLARTRRLAFLFQGAEIRQIKPQTGCTLDMADMSLENFELENAQKPEKSEPDVPSAETWSILESQPPGRQGETFKPVSKDGVRKSADKARKKHPHDSGFADSLIRCTKCILPETMPFIKFDEKGVCNYCNQYLPIHYHGSDALEEIVAPYRGKTKGPDCLVGISGGRDSTFGLHYIKNILGMNPVAYTYDWGMVTDLARRNIARVCGKLGVEHILVSADIKTKRKNIGKNVNAWLKKPELGMIPLFMAGDKQYFYHASRLKKQMGIDILFLCENMLERTHFKVGFAGLMPSVFDQEHVYTMSAFNKAALLFYYGSRFAKNPGYLNSSLPDTAFAYACYYLIGRQYYNLFNYIVWEEREVESILLEHYDWEMAPDTTTTWRIGDGTASFYNYAYYTIAGFTENDALRSNQIREGVILRDKALSLVREENKPRFESIKWYCDTAGLDFFHVLDSIAEAPKIKPQAMMV